MHITLWKKGAFRKSLTLPHTGFTVFQEASGIKNMDDRTVWQKKPLRVVLLYLFISVLLYWNWPFRTSVPPGYGVTVLALAAAVMTVLGEMKGTEKVAWILLLFGFVWIELTSIKVERKAQEDVQRGIAGSFGRIGSQMSDATEKLGNIAGMETTTLAGLKETENTVTGGDSFCYLDFYPALNNVAVTTVIKVGKYPLRGVSVMLTDRVKINAAMQAVTKNYPPGSLPRADEIRTAVDSNTFRELIPDFATPTRNIGGYQLTASDKQSFDMIFSAFNGSWIERLEIRNVGDKWAKAILVETERKERPYFFKIDANYPRINGHLDVPWPRPVKGKPEWER